MELPLSQITTSNVVTTIATIILGRIIWQLIQNLLYSSIPSSVPGPLIARLTTKWITIIELSGSRGRTVDALHKKYGPVVRLSPNELSFSTLPCIKTIYGNGSSCIKSSAYDKFGRKGMFQMADPEQHRLRQKRIAHIFAPAVLQQMEILIQNCVGRLVGQQLRKRSGTEVDMLHWARMTVLDVGGELMLGKSFGALDDDGDRNDAPTYVHHLDNAYIAWSLYGLSPTLFRLFEYLPIKSLQEFLAAGDYVYKYGDDAMKQYIHRHGRKSAQKSLLTKMLAGDPVSGIEPLADAEISTEVSNLIFAATDTTGNTITYALYELACHTEWQTRLREEILTRRGPGTSSEDYLSFKSLSTLPILNGVFMETLRLHPAAPSALPRVTTGTGCQIGELHIPGGTLVSMQALTLQRDPNYFPEPDTFKPDRWISDDGKEIEYGSQEQREMMIVWGKGTRTCLGQHMATMESKIALARIVAQFEVRLPAGNKTHKEMEMTDHFTLIPKGKRCTLVVREVEVPTE
ncbi:cytochrome P450 [Apodospora peruviana]|uniref:Cytochrome P450 n=1 Tax=Apodospora peruviana TaxID=516989 RepID=A0AAE0M5G3_9PEZI|nr:cytochrome P450 [Apodospora peruviana]